MVQLSFVQCPTDDDDGRRERGDERRSAYTPTVQSRKIARRGMTPSMRQATPESPPGSSLVSLPAVRVLSLWGIIA